MQNLLGQCFWVKGRTCLGTEEWVVACHVSCAAFSGSAAAKGHASQISRVRFYLPSAT